VRASYNRCGNGRNVYPTPGRKSLSDNMLHSSRERTRTSDPVINSPATSLQQPISKPTLIRHKPLGLLTFGTFSRTLSYRRFALPLRTIRALAGGGK
jgi:hypothetical protein